MNSAQWTTALSGAIFLANLIVGLFFCRFWTKTKDRLFLFFAMAFAMLAFERMLLLIVHPVHEFRYYIYTARLIAFVLIVVGILDKNKK